MGKRRIDPRVEIGYVRLRVPDLARALEFYERLLGFEITQRIGRFRALLSAGGSHVHLELDAAPFTGEGPDVQAMGPFRIAIRYPNRESLGDALLRVTDAGVQPQGAWDQGIREVLVLEDPDGNTVELYCDRRREDWPLAEDGTLRDMSKPLDVAALRRARTAARDRAAAPGSPAPLTPLTQERLRDMRLRLLNLHKVLLEDARAAYEMDRGRVASNASLLQLVISDPWFAWLHPLSELVVRIDETLQADAPATEADGVVLLEQVGRLLSPEQGADGFAQRYYDALQRQPAVIVAHAEVRRILKQAK
jgi:catechol 2,3-dioxygenase